MGGISLLGCIKNLNFFWVSLPHILTVAKNIFPFQLPCTKVYINTRDVLASAPANFFIETVLSEISNVVYYIDDILVTGKHDHITSLKEVFKRLREDGIRANRETKVHS